MNIEVMHIDCPKEWEGVDDYSSHLPMLWLALYNAKGNVVELGGGYGSSPLLDKYCYENRLMFTTWDNNKDWHEMITKKCLMETTAVGLCREYINNEYIKQDISKAQILFIDCAPGEIRKHLINEYKNVPVIIIHDTEPGAEYVYGMSEILSTFKYRLNYQPEGEPHTTAVSNITDVTQWLTQK